MTNYGKSHIRSEIQLCSKAILHIIQVGKEPSRQLNKPVDGEPCVHWSVLFLCLSWELLVDSLEGHSLSQVPEDRHLHASCLLGRCEYSGRHLHNFQTHMSFECCKKESSHSMRTTINPPNVTRNYLHLLLLYTNACKRLERNIFKTAKIMRNFKDLAYLWEDPIGCKWH